MCIRTNDVHLRCRPTLSLETVFPCNKNNPQVAAIETPTPSSARQETILVTAVNSLTFQIRTSNVQCHCAVVVTIGSAASVPHVDFPVSIKQQGHST